MAFLHHKAAETEKTFDRYVSIAARRALLGPANAERIMVFGSELLRDATLADLQLIADGTRPPDIPERGNGPDLADTIAPLVRTIHDFISGEEVRYHTPQQASSWSAGEVDVGEITLIGPSKGKVWGTEVPIDGDEDTNTGLPVRGLVIINQYGDNGVHFSPNWPALMPEEFNYAVCSRKRGDGPRAKLRLFGRTMVGLSYFDEQATDSEFTTAIRIMLRHWDTPPRLT